MMVIPRTVVDTEQLSATRVDVRQVTEKHGVQLRKGADRVFKIKAWK